jgi:hypothetical protein
VSVDSGDVDGAGDLRGYRDEVTPNRGC